MRIITISREFGSGGRELGRHMAELLGFEYYDKEIIGKIAEEEGLDTAGVGEALVNRGWLDGLLTFRKSFSSSAYGADSVGLLGTEKLVIEEIGKAGNDCVVVGRCSDVYLKQYNPFNIFVCADMATAIASCRKSGDTEGMSDREVEKEIIRINKKRAALHDSAEDTVWGDRLSYHITVNTTGWSVQELATAVNAFALNWFAKNSVR